jgi:hypothetical protein
MGVIAGMDLELHLANGEVTMRVRLDECRERVKLGSFDVNFEDVNKRMT